MHGSSPSDRRSFLTAAGGLLIIGPAALGQQGGQPEKKAVGDKKREGDQKEKDERSKNEPGSAEEEVTPGEDLMQEHGVLKRILLIYRESVRRIQAGEEVSPDAIADSAKLIREFVEDYHEHNEEQFIFPRLRKEGQQVELVDTLLRQHAAGRALTDQAMHLATPAGLKSPDDRTQLVRSLSQFIRMYEPHEAREDTVLFPAFRKIVSANEYDSLGEDFEKREHEHFGEDGFEKSVAKVAAIEKALGIYELDKFTPDKL
jgi:hemerythrin-like domain-containing protein